MGTGLGRIQCPAYALHAGAVPKRRLQIGSRKADVDMPVALDEVDDRGLLPRNAPRRGAAGYEQRAKCRQDNVKHRALEP